MKSILAILLMLALPVLAFAQVPPPDSAWSYTYGGGSWECCYSLQQTFDGGYILAGETQSYGSGQEDFYLVKTDYRGTTLWTRTFGGSEMDICNFVS